FFQAEDGIRDPLVTGVQTCALPISSSWLTSQLSSCGALNKGLLDEGNELPNNKGGQKLKHQAQYRKGKKKLHKENLELLPVKENLRLHEGPPEGPPEELLEEIPDEEILGFEEFEEGSSDNESDEKK